MEPSFYKQLPKIELHCHLHGCVRKSTIIELYKQKHSTEEVHSVEELIQGDRSLQDCFKLFDVIHSVITTKATLQRITRELVEDFVSDGVVYAEIRTTPRVFMDGEYLSEKEGIDVILDEIKNCESVISNKIVVRLLLSINRSESAFFNHLHVTSREKALRTAEMAVQYREAGEKYIVGVELSGNPTAAPFSYFFKAFEYLREHSIPTTIHVGEVPNSKLLTSKCCCMGDEFKCCQDTYDIVHYHPERLGHCLFLNSDELEYVQRHGIPIEVCPTSNRMTLGLSNLEDHPILRKIESTIPFSINTDDTALFDITLSQEIQSVASVLHWNRDHVISYTRACVGQILDKDSQTRDFLNDKVELFSAPF